MHLHDALKTALTEAAARLGLPLGFEGEPFLVPLTPHLRARVVYEPTRAAGLGACGLNYVEGALEARAVTAAGAGDDQARELARRLAALFPRGATLPLDDGECVLRTPSPGTAVSDGGRIGVPVHIPFYAFITEN